MAEQATEILLVEDNEGDAALLKEALSRVGWEHRLSTVSDGRSALRWLRRQEHFHQVPRPDIIVLDLNLPIVSGREVLAAIRPDPELGKIPVVILTSSTVDYDLVPTYRLQDGAYLLKPDSFDEYVSVARRIRQLCEASA